MQLCLRSAADQADGLGRCTSNDRNKPSAGPRRRPTQLRLTWRKRRSLLSITLDAMESGVRLATLTEIDAAIWQQLGRAAHDRHHEWHRAVLATVDAGRPDARTVILREVDADARSIAVYSDSRAAKVAQLAAQPAAVLVCWSRQLGWQLRLKLAVTVETDGIAVTSRWAHVKLSPSAEDYLSAIAPGSPLQAADSLPAASEREHFAVLEARVLAIDWLELHRDGHRRAAFDAATGARWLQP
jgi:hypothetical protein